MTRDLRRRGSQSRGWHSRTRMYRPVRWRHRAKCDCRFSCSQRSSPPPRHCSSCLVGNSSRCCARGPSDATFIARRVLRSGQGNSNPTATSDASRDLFRRCRAEDVSGRTLPRRRRRRPLRPRGRSRPCRRSSRGVWVGAARRSISATPDSPACALDEPQQVTRDFDLVVVQRDGLRHSRGPLDSMTPGNAPSAALRSSA